jgi:hypothetical protein
MTTVKYYLFPFEIPFPINSIIFSNFNLLKQSFSVLIITLCHSFPNLMWRSLTKLSLVSSGLEWGQGVWLSSFCLSHVSLWWWSGEEGWQKSKPSGMVRRNSKVLPLAHCSRFWCRQVLVPADSAADSLSQAILPLVTFSQGFTFHSWVCIFAWLWQSQQETQQECLPILLPFAANCWVHRYSEDPMLFLPEAGC